MILLRSHRRWLWSGALAVMGGVSAVFVLHGRPASESPQAFVSAAPKETSSPPWIYGRPDARFTIIEYADLQCEYCRAYFPILRQWIDQNPQVKWQWHHLPLSVHEPAATQAARLAECAGQAAGNKSFWTAIAWVYANPQEATVSRVPPPRFPVSSPAFRFCLEGQKPDDVIRAQTQEAGRDGVMATPTLRLTDGSTGRALLLSGPVEGDALLSAFDFLLAPPEAEESGAEALIEHAPRQQPKSLLK